MCDLKDRQRQKLGISEGKLARLTRLIIEKEREKETELK